MALQRVPEAGRAVICMATASRLYATSHGAPAQGYHVWGRVVNS